MAGGGRALVAQGRGPGDKPIPNYPQIFRAPARRSREGGILYGKKFLNEWYQDELMKYLRNHEKAKQWLSDLDDFERLEGESMVKWVIRFAGMKCKEQAEQIVESGLDAKVHIEPLCFGGTQLVWDAEDIGRYLENHLDYKKKRKAKEKEGAEREALPLAICPVNEEDRKRQKKDDVAFLMEELGKETVEEVWAMLNDEIKMAKKITEDKLRFRGYTKLRDFEKLHLLATYYREKRGQ